MAEQNTFAIAELQQKANDGDAQAQFDLALCYANGTAIEKNEEQAFDWLKKATEQGFAEAQCGLAGCYFKGKGVEQSYRRAFEWYEKAAEQGYAEAENWLNEQYAKFANIHFDDDKFTRDNIIDFGWVNKPNRLAHYNIRGSRKWFEVAAERGNTKAKNWLDEQNIKFANIDFDDEKFM